MNKLLLLVVLTLGTTFCVTGCTGNNATTDKAKDQAQGTKDKGKGPEDKVKVFAEVASNPKATFRDRKEAVELLRSMGAKAKNAVPNLVKAFEDETLVESGQAPTADVGVDVLGRAFLTEELKASIAQTLGQLGTDAKDAIPALTKKLKSWKSTGGSDGLGDSLMWGMNGYGKTYLACADALWKIEKKAESVVPMLTLSAKYGDDKEKVTALKDLGEIGPEAKSAVPVISSCRSSASADVRFAAEQALKKIDPSTTSKDK